MTQYALRLPDSVYRGAQQMAEREHVSLNQFITLAVAEKLASLNTAQFLAEKAARADLPAFDRILDQVPDHPPRPGDEIR